MIVIKSLAILLIAAVSLFETGLAQYGIPPIDISFGGNGPVGDYGAQGNYGSRRGYEGRGEYGPGYGGRGEYDRGYGGRGEYGPRQPGRGYGQGYGYI